MNNTALIITIIIFVVALIIESILFYEVWRRYREENKELMDLYQDALNNISSKESQVVKVYEQRIRDIKQDYENHISDIQNSYTPKPSKDALKKSQEIIEEAEITAKSIIAEANERTKLMIERKYKEANSSIVKIVVKVVQKVIGKSLSYQDHKSLILESLEQVK